MVYAIEEPTELQPELLDRSIGRSIFSDTNLFTVCQSELFPEAYGVVAQNQTEDSVQTLTLDARKKDSHYTWQLISTDRISGRSITNLKVGHNGDVSVWQAKYDVAGRLETVHDIDIWSGVWNQIQGILKSKETREQAEKLFATKQRKIRSLAELSIVGKINNEYPVWEKDTNKSSTVVETNVEGKFLVRTTKKLNDIELAAAQQKQQSSIDKIGYVLLKPLTRPSIPAIAQQLPLDNLFLGY